MNDLCPQDYFQYPMMAVASTSLSAGAVNKISVPSGFQMHCPQGYRPYWESDRDQEPYRKLGNGVVEVLFEGPIRPTRPWWSGSKGMDELEAALVRAGNDQDVETVIFRVSQSPGGSLFGLEDVSKVLIDLREQKTLIGFGQHYCHSAGMWLLSQCSQVVCDPTAMIGSLGIFATLIDSSEFAKAMGFVRVIVSSGGVKGLNHEDGIDKKLLEDVQREVDDAFRLFKMAFARGRNYSGRSYSDKEIDDLFDGRAFQGEKALEKRLVDGVQTYREFLEATVNGNGATQPSTTTETEDDDVGNQGLREKLLALLNNDKGEEETTTSPPAAANQELKEAYLAGAKLELMGAAQEDVKDSSIPAKLREQTVSAMAAARLQGYVDGGDIPSTMPLTAKLIALGNVAVKDVLPGVDPASAFKAALDATPKFVADEHTNLLLEREGHPGNTEPSAGGKTEVTFPMGHVNHGGGSEPTWQSVQTFAGGTLARYDVDEETFKLWQKEEG